MITARGADHSSEVPAAVLPKLPATVDTQGRLRVSKAQRREILAALARSGESLPQFARRTGLKYATLARWVQRNRPKRPDQPPQLRLLEAVVAPTPATGTDPRLVVELPGGVRVEVAEEKQVALAASLVRALTQPC